MALAHQETECSRLSNQVQLVRFSSESETPRGLKQPATAVTGFTSAAGRFFLPIRVPTHPLSHFSGAADPDPSLVVLTTQWQRQTINEK